MNSGPHRWLQYTCALLALIIAIPLQAKTDISGEIGLEGRFFFESPLDSRQHDDNLSLYLKTEFFRKLDNNWRMTFTPFYRLDQNDHNRTHGDIRELLFHKVSKQWELKMGISKVFWGVTESQHLVDIINQTDAIESPDGEDKLGQPMINLIMKRKWGTTELFVLPYFRERTFQGIKGRLRPLIPIDTSQTQYQSSDKEKHIDLAARWFKTIGIWDVGLSHFSGTSRNPRFTPGIDGIGNPVLVPVYDLIEQTGLDLQATKGNWLWKLEVIRQQNDIEPFTALTAGFEYTKNSIFKSKKDLGILFEFLFDDRNDATLTPFERDYMIGMRIGFNDVQSSQLLAGVILDEGSDEKAWFLEYSRRVGKSYKVSVEARVFSNVESTSPLYSLSRDSHIQIEFIKHF